MCIRDRYQRRVHGDKGQLVNLSVDIGETMDDAGKQAQRETEKRLCGFSIPGVSYDVIVRMLEGADCKKDSSSQTIFPNLFDQSEFDKNLNWSTKGQSSDRRTRTGAQEGDSSVCLDIDSLRYAKLAAVDYAFYAAQKFQTRVYSDADIDSLKQNATNFNGQTDLFRPIFQDPAPLQGSNGLRDKNGALSYDTNGTN
eukprot:TRINITY_DN3690_c0_g1_i1.p1 TRINITY_DN3690_c0_g1~~TRINITY_DN3690_c0_g1_i1.p1  ORF type:complete len:217 (+),score=38.53 TRINITY_DN3690_c0_g1_i1:61-651(+)